MHRRFSCENPKVVPPGKKRTRHARFPLFPKGGGGIHLGRLRSRFRPCRHMHIGTQILALMLLARSTFNVLLFKSRNEVARSNLELHKHEGCYMYMLQDEHKIYAWRDGEYLKIPYMSSGICRSINNVNVMLGF